MTRNFDSLLSKEIEKARFKKYKLGEHDCALFAINVIKEIYGIDYGERIKGFYSSKIGYLKLWKEIGGSSLQEITEIIIGEKGREMIKVGRGNLVLYKDDVRGEHLGICIGDKVAIVSVADELIFIDILECECCWRIG